MSSNPPRIAYFGLPLGALALSRAGFTPLVVVLGHTDAPGARRVRRVLGRRALVLGKPDLDDASVRDVLASARPDALLSWFYPKRIPEPVLRLAPRGAFGAHPSLLPRWRGPDPYFWALFSGDVVTGVTLHRLEREYDTGALIDHVEVPVGPRDNAYRLAKRLDAPGLRLMLACAARLAAGDALLGTSQDAARVTEAPAPDEALLEIDWHEPADVIVRLVRAAAPYPGASAQIGDEVVEVLEAARHPAPLPRALEPADAVWTGQGLVIRAADAGVQIRRVRHEDGRTSQGAALHALFPGGLARLDGSTAG